MSDDHKIRVPPNSKDSEMMVLGCMLTNVNSLNSAADALDDSDFYYTEHKILFQILKHAYQNDKPADVHLVCEELKRQDKLKAVGGSAYVATLAQYAGTAAYIEEYTDIVRSKSILRRMILAAQEVEKGALSDPSDVSGALDDAQQKFFQISQSASPAGGILLRDLLSGAKAAARIPYLKELQGRQEQFQLRGPEESGVTGVPTHFVDLDKMIDGFAPSNLIILAARPAMGKTALALGIAENICFKSGVPTGIFSLEMSAEQLLHRLICSQSEVESDKIRTGALNGIEFQRIVAAVNAMQQSTMIIDDQPGLKITDLRARARRMKEAHSIGLLVIDYLQLLSGSGTMRTTENRQNEISEISRMLKNLARELNIPVLCLSQLSRKVEERTGHRPMMSDLRESGCLTGDALIKNAETGRLHAIKELAERGAQAPIPVFAVDEHLKIGVHTLTRAFYSGKKTVYTLTTRIGRTIRASANHPFLTSEGWTRLDQLKQGDAIALMTSDACGTHTRAVPRRHCLLQENAPSQSTLSSIDWDTISSISEGGVEEVYDATVPGVHNFVANDILVHNSIEQDSDVVMFLLRREYYDPYDKPGTAELIVAKNRHGGIGSVNLTFRKELAQFANFSSMHTVEKSDDDAFAAFSPGKDDGEG
jgi:replicative DNA helicase